MDWKITTPTVIHFSGGRTSAYMLRLALDANGGRIPEGSHVVFCNTGKERPETLDFVRDAGERWGVPVVWLEYRNAPATRRRRVREPGKPAAYEQVRGWSHSAVRVDYATASRDGEPFEAAIRARNFLPNPSIRFCTGELKIKTCGRWLRAEGVGEYESWVGLRADEPRRVAKLMRAGERCVEETLFGAETVRRGRGDELPGEKKRCPLAEAGVSADDVEAFWRASRGGMPLGEWLATPAADRPGFDLALRPDEGNCDLCFLKGFGKRLELIRERPESADWWARMEAMGLGVNGAGTGFFRRAKDGPNYAELKAIATGESRVSLPLFDDDMTAACVGCTD